MVDQYQDYYNWESNWKQFIWERKYRTEFIIERQSLAAAVDGKWVFFSSSLQRWTGATWNLFEMNLNISASKWNKLVVIRVLSNC